LQEEKDRPTENPHTSLEELAMSDIDLNEADNEDNVSFESSSDESFNSNDDSDQEDLNGSFRGGYVPNRDINRVDKGQGNP
jgi:sensor domain CHASE-containing protein